MKTIQKKCEKLKKHKKKLEQEIVNLKSHMEKNMIECGQIEQYKWEIEEKTKQELVQKLKQVNLFLQVNYIQYVLILFTASYVLGVYAVCVPSISFVAICFIHF